MPLLLIILVVVGYLVGSLATENVVLPLLWAWPKARRLARANQLVRPIPVSRFVVAPLFWLAVVVASVWLVDAAFSAVALAAYVGGLVAHALSVFRLVLKPNGDMEADFNDAYGSYLSTRAEASNQIRNHSDG
jgi:hypothetical protein